MDALKKINKVRQLPHTGLKSLMLGVSQLRNRTMPVESAYRIHGPSPAPGSSPIFVLHDCLGSKKNWESICQKITISTNMTVIAVDARNHGDSPDDCLHGYYDLAEDISYLLNKLSVEKGIFIGHSMGGRTAMVYALNEPAKVASLVVVDISPVSTPSGLADFYPNAIDFLKTVDIKGMDLSKAKRTAREKIIKSGIIQSELDLQLILMNLGTLRDKNTVGWRYNLDALKKNVKKIVSFPIVPDKQYYGPTLFLGGQMSYAVPPEDLVGIHKLFPYAYLFYIQGAGHNVHVDNPHSFTETVMQFLYHNSLLQTA